MIHFITHEFAPFRGGIATYVRETANAAAKLGFPVKVIAPDYGAAVHPGDAQERFPIDRVRCSGRLTPAGIWSLARALAARRAQLRESKIALLSPGAHMAMMLARAMNWIHDTGPVVAFFHGSEALRFSSSPIWKNLAARFFPNTKPACASQFVEALIREKKFFAADANIIRAPCACPAEITHAASSGVYATDSTTNTNNIIEFLTLARLHPRKGQLHTANALGLLPADLKRRLRYVMAGDGPASYRDAIARACGNAGVEHVFRAIESPNARPAIYASCDVHVMTSVRLPDSIEGFGISYLEASMFGKPNLAFRTGGVEEAVLHDQTGLIVDEGNLPALAAAMQRLIEDAPLRNRLGRAGREFAQSFSWETAARALCAD